MSKRAYKNERGQVVIMLAIIIPFIILLLAIVVNVSLLVHQRVRMQNAVDAGAYSAAASFARDLNRIAELNYNIEQIWRGNDTGNPNNFIGDWDQSFDQYIDDTSYNGENMAQALHNRYQNDYGAIIGEIQRIGSEAFNRAIEFANQAARLTYYNGNEELANSNPSNVTLESLFDSSTQGRGFMDYQEHTENRSIPYVNATGACNPAWDACAAYDELSVVINTPINKLNQIAFVAKAAAHPGFIPLVPTRFVVDPWQLTAFAKAQPYGGSIEGFSNVYGATLIPLGVVNGTRFYH